MPQIGSPLPAGAAVTGFPAAVADGSPVRAHFDELGRRGVFLAGDGISNAVVVNPIFVDGAFITDNGLTVTARLHAVAPDGFLDRLTTLGNVSLDGLGQLSVSGAIPGAGVVIAARQATVGPSTTRVTVATPTAGTRIRIISVIARNASTTVIRVEVYFATGANITTTAGKEITEPLLDLTDLPSQPMVWPDGAGPVGAVDDVVSLRTGSDITNNVSIVIQYREE